MSSTQMDLSPKVIDRKQDIASWPEGDIDQLAARDKNRYQKRKSAIIEYFQSDQPVKEISARHRLSATDVLETMARRCCMLHEDGQQWGFRALVPGVKVVDASQPAPAALSGQTQVAGTRAVSERTKHVSTPVELADQAQAVSEDVAEKEADTGEHQAIVVTKFTELPVTPIPDNLEVQAEPVMIRAKINFSDEPEEEAAEAAESEFEIKQEELPASMALEETVVDEEVAQEEFPAITGILEETTVDEDTQVETIASTEVEQQELPTITGAGEATTTSAPEVEQEELQAATETAEETTISALEAEQQELPTATGIVEETTSEKVEQQEFSFATGTAEETTASAEVEQVEFPTLPGVVGETTADEKVEQQEFPAPASETEVSTDEVAEDEKGEREELSTPTVEETVASAEEEQEETSKLVNEVAASEEPEWVEEDDELGGEPTGKLSAVKPVQQGEPSESAEDESDEAVDVDLLPTSALLAGQNDESGEHETVAEVEVIATAEVVDKEAEVDELDTVEVAKVVIEERLNRVAATETIKVPAAMLEALEKADQELQARDEVSEETALSTEVVDASGQADSSVATPPEVSEPAETQISVLPALNRGEVAAIPTQTLETWRRDSRQLTQAPVLKAPTQSLVEDSRYRVTGSQVALKHAVRRRWGKQGRQQKYRRWVRIISAAIVVSLLVILLIPLGVGLVGYNTYTNIKNVASDGVNNLLSLKALIPANKSDITSVLDTQKLSTAKTNLQKAQSDFLQLQDTVNRPDIESLLEQFAPQYSGELDMARHMVQVALDVSRMGQELIGVGQMVAPVLHGSGSLLSSSSTTPLLSADEVNAVEAALLHAQYYISDIQTQMSQVNLNAVPIGNKTEKAEMAKYLNEIPQAQSAISQAQTLVGPVAWLLGVGQARHFLVQTLDRAELRPSGGFEGQYGLLTLQNGRMSPFTLKDITDLDYAENGAELQRLPPSQYSWMNFGNWGVRDANLSADFPTNAQLVMRVFQEEGGGPIDGDIQFTPVLISQLLQLTGPIYVQEYHETVTAQNLEDKLHYYQQNFSAINVQREKTGTSNASTRKAFTTLVGKLLLDRVHTLKINQLMSFSKVLLQDLKTRDLQIYFTNPVAEQWLVQNEDSGAMPRFTNGNDGFMVVQANISISKATQYVHSTFNDQVTLDAQGGATHNLTITLDYNQKGPIYGFDTYTDYVRVYAPANAQFQGGDGFVNPAHALCTPGSTKPGKKGTTSSGGTPTGCGQYNSYYPDSGRYCSSGNYSLGTGYVAGKGFIPWPVYAPSGPTEKQSDLPGYKMWGGLTQTPKNCTSTITLSWYVPHAVQKTPGQAPYQMIVGHQAGWPDTAQVSIDASALKGVKSLKYNQTINVDTLVALAPLPPSQQKPGSTPTPAITSTATPKKP